MEAGERDQVLEEEATRMLMEEVGARVLREEAERLREDVELETQSQTADREQRDGEQEVRGETGRQQRGEEAEGEEKGEVINCCTRQNAREMERARSKKAGGHGKVRGAGLCATATPEFLVCARERLRGQRPGV